MTTHSQLYRLAEERLDGSLAEFVAARWPGMGWRKISAELKEQTGIEVSHTALRRWFAGRITVETVVKVA
jgi:hypothetical protein